MGKNVLASSHFLLRCCAETVRSRKKYSQRLHKGFAARHQVAPDPAVSGGYFAILLGDPSRFGPLVIRRRFHADARINPHTHLARTYTVLEGEWALGFGERFDLAPLRRFPAVTIYRLPPGVPHFQVTGPHGAVVQIETYGPTRRISSSTIMRVGNRLRD